MKNTFLTMLLVIFASGTSLFAQKSSETLAKQYLNDKGEVIFTFSIDDKSSLSTITKEVSIVHYDETTKIVKVMANKTQFTSFLQKEIHFNVVSTDNVVGYRTMTSNIPNKATTFPLTEYPTYADYVTIMNEFATANPSLCKVENIGATTEGDKSLLFVKLSDNVNSNEKEPRIMYTSSMHGDEITGYPMMLTLIDYLLGAYKDTSHPKHAEIKNLLDTSEVWINPLANPDGTFNNSANNTSVANATRGNANNIDLNRNYPDPDDGPNPDGNTYQTETLAFMNFADSKHFVLSANFHGGIELVNYPWDTYAGAHPDEDYFIHISEEYRDFCQANSPSGYFDDLNNGITNGYAWYEVQGGRQDYQIYNQKGREVTVELSNNKAPNSSELENYWNYNKDALVAFLKQVNYGISGVVTDAITNQPIEARITVIGKENYESWVPTELPEGDYYRPIKAGTYSVLYEAECYEPVTLTGVTISDYASVIQDVQLTPIGGGTPTGLSVTSIQSASVALSWQGTSNATYDVRYRVLGGTNWTDVSSSTNTTTITGLLANTSYEAQVRSNCTGGVSSPYSASINFTTVEEPACTGINNFPYTESFESGLGFWENSNADDIEWTRNSGGTPSNTTGPSSGQDGSFYLYTEASGSASPDKTALLTSPCIDLSNLSGASLEFGYHMYGTDMGTLEVLISTDGGNSYTSIWTRNGDLGNTWNQAIISLAVYSGSVVKLQFKGTTGTGFRSDMAIDIIKIQSSTTDTEAPSAPTNLVTSNITGTSITLSWNSSTDNVSVTGYDVYQGTTLIDSGVNGLLSVVSGLTPNTTYNFSIIAKDAAGNASPPSNEVSATTLEEDIVYCTSLGNNVDYEYIDFVGIGSLNNTTTATSGYSDYTNLGATNIPYGANTITLSVGFANSSYTEYWGVWIDYNKNETFEASEEVVTASTTSAANQAYNFSIPSTALSGETRMRVSMKYDAAPSACETFSYGEVEDYTVNIGGVTFSKKNNIENNLEEIVIFPNPVEDGFLFIKGVKNKNSSFRVINFLGQTVMNSKLLENKIDVTNLTGGIYMLQLNTGQKTISKRFIITK